MLAIEVDGFRAHEDDPRQLVRDCIKDSGLEQAGIPLPRLPTTGSGGEQRIRHALEQAQLGPIPL